MVKSPGGSHGVEYQWKERAKFKYGCPEGMHVALYTYDYIYIMYTIIVNINDFYKYLYSSYCYCEYMFYFCGCLLYLCVELHQCGVHDLTSLPSSTSSSFTSNVEGASSHVSYLDKVKLLHPPEVVVLSLYEKSFFADTKLGDLTLPLSSVTLNKYVYVSCICIRK